MIIRKSDGRVWGVVADCTSVSARNSNESWFSPGWTPGVLDFPGRLISADYKDSVVDAVSAIAQNSSSVKGPVGSIHCNWKRPWGKSVEHVVTSRNIDEAGNSVGTSIWSLTLLVSSHVGVLLLCLQTMILYILEGWVNPSSITTHIAIGSWAVY